MFCTKCGAELKSEATFCTECGGKQSSRETKLTLQKNRKRKIHFSAIFWGVVVLFIIIAMQNIFITNKGGLKSATDIKKEIVGTWEAEGNHILYFYITFFDDGTYNSRTVTGTYSIEGDILDLSYFKESADFYKRYSIDNPLGVTVSTSYSFSISGNKLTLETRYNRIRT